MVPSAIQLYRDWCLFSICGEEYFGQAEFNNLLQNTIKLGSTEYIPTHILQIILNENIPPKLCNVATLGFVNLALCSTLDNYLSEIFLVKAIRLNINASFFFEISKGAIYSIIKTYFEDDSNVVRTNKLMSCLECLFRFSSPCEILQLLFLPQYLLQCSNILTTNVVINDHSVIALVNNAEPFLDSTLSMVVCHVLNNSEEPTSRAFVYKIFAWAVINCMPYLGNKIVTLFIHKLTVESDDNIVGITNLLWEILMTCDQTDLDAYLSSQLIFTSYERERRGVPEDFKDLIQDITYDSCSREVFQKITTIEIQQRIFNNTASKSSVVLSNTLCVDSLKSKLHTIAVINTLRFTRLLASSTSNSEVFCQQLVRCSYRLFYYEPYLCFWS